MEEGDSAQLSSDQEGYYSAEEGEGGEKKDKNENSRECHDAVNEQEKLTAEQWKVQRPCVG